MQPKDLRFEAIIKLYDTNPRSVEVKINYKEALLPESKVSRNEKQLTCSFNRFGIVQRYKVGLSSFHPKYQRFPSTEEASRLDPTGRIPRQACASLQKLNVK